VGGYPLLVRWISDFDCELATQFWYIIRTGSYEIEQLSKSTKKHIRQAFKKCYVRKIEDNEIEKMYSCYQAAYKRYEKADNFRSFESIKDEFLNRKNKNMFYYGAFELETNSLIVFLSVLAIRNILKLICRSLIQNIWHYVHRMLYMILF